MSTLTQMQPTMAEFGAWLKSQTPGHGQVLATVLHHTEVPSAVQYEGRGTIEAIKRYHMRTRGFSDIAANAYACPDGTVFTGRPLSAGNWAHALISIGGNDRAPDWNRVEREARALADGDHQFFNKYGFGLETVANFDREPTRAARSGVSLETALRVLTVVHTVYKLPASRLFFHRDVADKTCPGTGLDRAITRAELARRLEAASMADIDGWAQAAVDRVIHEGIMSRDPDGRFRGNDPLTRQEAATAMVRLLDKVRAELRQTREVSPGPRVDSAG